MKPAMLTTLVKAHQILDELTPLAQDCGMLCGQACCRPDEDGQGGVWLLPGEEELIRGRAWAEILPGEPPVLMCSGMCERQLRPFLCRLFPLLGVVKGGQWEVRLDRRAWALCPLMASGMRALEPRFVEGARQAVRLLGQDENYAPILKKWAKLERAYARRDILEVFHGAD